MDWWSPCKSSVSPCPRPHSKWVTEFAVPQIEYPLGGISKKCSHVYFLLIITMVLLLWRQIVLLWHQVTMILVSEQHLFQTIVQFDKTIGLSRKLATGSIHDYLFCYCPLVGIQFDYWEFMACLAALIATRYKGFKQVTLFMQ